MDASFLTDVQRIWGEGEDRLPSSVILLRLQALDSAAYGKWNVMMFGQAMRAIGAPTTSVKYRRDSGGWLTLRGVRHRDLLAAQPLEPCSEPFEPEQDGAVVYFAERQGFMKIGYTANLTDRMQALNRGDSAIVGMTIVPVRLLATMPGAYQVEKAIHQLFHHLRFEGEWFLYEGALVRFVEAIAEIRTATS